MLSYFKTAKASDDRNYVQTVFHSKEFLAESGMPNENNRRNPTRKYNKI